MSLSISGWNTWDQCPAKYRYSYVEKRPRGPSHPAAARGTEIHASVDQFMQGKSEEIHPEIRFRYGQWLSSLRMHRPMPEMKFAVTKNWEWCDFEDPDRMWRGIIDLACDMSEGERVVDLYEWKTGQIYDSHKYQAELYALIGLVKWENADLSRVTNVYFDQKQNTPPAEMRREDLEGYKMMWLERYNQVMDDDIYPANPGWYCRYCDHSRGNHGPCQF